MTARKPPHEHKLQCGQRGVSHCNAKLTPEIVQELRRSCGYGWRGESMAAAARRLGVSRQAIWAAVRGYSWKHVDER